MPRVEWCPMRGCLRALTPEGSGGRWPRCPEHGYTYAEAVEQRAFPCPGCEKCRPPAD